MNFVSRADVEAPIDYVFESLSDFGGFEKAALRRGAEVVRIDTLAKPARGAQWQALFTMRQKPRKVLITLEGYEPHTTMRFDGESKNIQGVLTIDLVELSAHYTRVQVRMDLRPTNLTARIMLQSMRLAKARLSERFKARAETFARGIQDRYHSGMSAGI
jgi:hypothetical protein